MISRPTYGRPDKPAVEAEPAAVPVKVYWMQRGNKCFLVEWPAGRVGATLTRDEDGIWNISGPLGGNFILLESAQKHFESQAFLRRHYEFITIPT